MRVGACFLRTACSLLSTHGARLERHRLARVIRRVRSAREQRRRCVAKGGTRLSREACLDFSVALGVTDRGRTAPRCRSRNIVHSSTKVPRWAVSGALRSGMSPTFHRTARDCSGTDWLGMAFVQQFHDDDGAVGFCEGVRGFPAKSASAVSPN